MLFFKAFIQAVALQQISFMHLSAEDPISNTSSLIHLLIAPSRAEQYVLIRLFK